MGDVRRKATLVMVFRPGREDPLGVSVCTHPLREGAVDKEWEVRKLACDRAWYMALKDIMWGAKEIANLIADEYLFRTGLRRKLCEQYQWREVVRVVELDHGIPPDDAGDEVS